MRHFLRSGANLAMSLPSRKISAEMLLQKNEQLHGGIGWASAGQTDWPLADGNFANVFWGASICHPADQTGWSLADGLMPQDIENCRPPNLARQKNGASLQLKQVDVSHHRLSLPPRKCVLRAWEVPCLCGRASESKFGSSCTGTNLPKTGWG